MSVDVEILKKICKEREIKHIAVVDDVFDVPAAEHLDRNRYSNFRQEYNSDQNLREAVASVSDIMPESLPSFDNLDDGDLEPLWEYVYQARIGEIESTTEHLKTLNDLFMKHAHDVLGMLDTVLGLISLFKQDLGMSVTVHGKGFKLDEIIKANIVAVDYFLDYDLTGKEALDTVLGIVVGVVSACREKGVTVPSFLLVSSGAPEDQEVEELRKRANLMQSRFRFFKKTALSAEKCRVEDLMNLHDLIDAFDRTEKIEHLIMDWKKGARNAVTDVVEEMLSLDISDFVYLDCFRLRPEGTSIGDYLRWFLTSSLSARVTGNLTKRTWQDANTIKLFDVTKEDGHIDPETLVKTFDGASDVIAKAYSNILFDKNRGTGDDAFFAPLPRDDLLEGDLFVRPKDSSQNSYDAADVRLVLTPSCDLLRRAPGEPPSADSVLLLPGELKKVRHEDQKNNFSKDYFIPMQEHGKMSLFRIDWRFKNPISVDWRRIRESKLDDTGREFMRLGCVRGLYFHRIRDDFFHYLTRIGTEVAPIFPRPISGHVYIEVKQREWKSVMHFSPEERLVCEIGPVLLKKSTKWKNDYVYLASRQFIQKLYKILRDLQGKEGCNLAESAKQNAEYLNKMQTYIDLLRPMKMGVRGGSKYVHFKKLEVLQCEDSHCKEGNNVCSEKTVHIAIGFSAPHNPD